MTDLMNEFLSEMKNKGGFNQIIDGPDLFRSYWYSKHLEALNEPVLSSIAEHDETYRFLWLRSFHHPITIRIWRTGDEKNMVFKELDGHGGDWPGKMIAHQARRITTDEWNKFINLIQEASYWQLPAVGEDSGLDGANWILEGKKDGQYHLVDLWSLGSSGNYREACLYLLKLSGQKPQEIY
jgi:hypothetical protein